MKVKPMLGDFLIDGIKLIESSESRSLVEHAVPGLEGSFFQDMGSVPNSLTIHGSKNGDDEREGFLEGIRAIFNKGEPTTFVADINTATDITEVMLENLMVSEVGGSPNSFRYTIKLRKYVKPPQPPSIGLLDDDILGDAMSLVDGAMNAIDALGSIPDFGNPTLPLEGSLNGVKSVLSNMAGVESGIENIFGKGE